MAVEWLNEALRLAQQAADEDEVPVGAVIVWKDPAQGALKIVGRGYNRREQDDNPIAHAEIIAIQDAARTTGHWRLMDCVMYVTLEPCPMCLAACQQARLEAVYYGVSDPKGGALSLGYPLHQDTRINHRFKVEPCEPSNSECGAILKRFFQRKRD
ncbi:MAG: nucleoside deaminase [Oligoflexia bacterium]|nr:nucleoside deaminase [Oligoflexia bacterium]